MCVLGGSNTDLCVFGGYLGSVLIYKMYSTYFIHTVGVTFNPGYTLTSIFILKIGENFQPSWVQRFSGRFLCVKQRLVCQSVQNISKITDCKIHVYYILSKH